MFRNRKDREERSFGQFDFLSIIPAVVSGTMSIGNTLIQSSTAKSIAKAQVSSQMTIAQMQADIQKRWQELELQKIQVQQAAIAAARPLEVATAAPGAPSLVAGAIPSSIFGIPILYLAIGAGALLLLSRKSGEA